MEFITKTLGEWMTHIGQTYPDKEVIVFEDTITVNKGTDREYSYPLHYRKTYSELDREIEIYARAFYKLGIRRLF